MKAEHLLSKKALFLEEKALIILSCNTISGNQSDVPECKRCTFLPAKDIELYFFFLLPSAHIQWCFT